MARRIPDDRFDALIDAAVEVFIDRGYTRTQMSDIAEAIGVAKGTLYRYVESKDALFAQCLAHADAPRPIPLPDPTSLPIATWPKGRLSAWIKEQLAGGAQLPALEAALERDHCDAAPAELESIVRELYDVMSLNRRGIKLLDRCMDHREIGPIWQTDGREGPRAALEHLLARRIEAGALPPVASVELAARFAIETIATWAVHIHWDQAPQRFDPDAARESAITLLVRALTG